MNLMFGEPYMMTASNIENIILDLKGKNIDNGDSVLVFKTVLKIAKHQINAQLYILFNKNIAKLIEIYK